MFQRAVRAMWALLCVRALCSVCPGAPSARESALNGVPVGELPQIFENPRAVVLKRETARRIGSAIPPGLLFVAEELFDTVAPDTED